MWGVIRGSQVATLRADLSNEHESRLMLMATHGMTQQENETLKVHPAAAALIGDALMGDALMGDPGKQRIALELVA